MQLHISTSATGVFAPDGAETGWHVTHGQSTERRHKGHGPALTEGRELPITLHTSTLVLPGLTCRALHVDTITQVNQVYWANPSVALVKLQINQPHS